MPFVAFSATQQPCRGRDLLPTCEKIDQFWFIIPRRRSLISPNTSQGLVSIVMSWVRRLTTLIPLVACLIEWEPIWITPRGALVMERLVAKFQSLCLQVSEKMEEEKWDRCRIPWIQLNIHSLWFSHALYSITNL
jgi:hypothetical protein